jgi:DNA-binding response OmpR family regulator
MEKERFRDNAARKTILVVDDEPILLNIQSEFLQRLGFHVITAMDGEEAVRTYQPHSVDLVILDIGLPGMQGFDCLTALFAINRDIKVIISSGYATEDDKEEALKRGASFYLPKPYTMQELLNATNLVLDQSAP